MDDFLTTVLILYIEKEFVEKFTITPKKHRVPLLINQFISILKLFFILIFFILIFFRIYKYFHKSFGILPLKFLDGTVVFTIKQVMKFARLTFKNFLLFFFCLENSFIHFSNFFIIHLKMYLLASIMCKIFLTFCNYPSPKININISYIINTSFLY